MTACACPPEGPWCDVCAHAPAEDRRRVPEDRREQAWEEASSLHTIGGLTEEERVRRTVLSLLAARRNGAADALLALAEKLEQGGARVRATPRLLRALAEGYRDGEDVPGNYSLNPEPR